MKVNSDDVGTLRALADKLEPRRKVSDPIFNDMYEAAEDWHHFGSMLAEGGNMDPSARTAQEVELLHSLRAHYGVRLDQDADYRKIMEIGAKFIAVAQEFKPPAAPIPLAPDVFGFLMSEFGMVPGNPSRKPWSYHSSRVEVDIGLLADFSHCWLRRLSDPPESHTLEDLLFMKTGQVGWLTLQPGRTLTAEADRRAWFSFVAGLLKQYGGDVLADRPGAFEALAAAEAERDRLITAEMGRLYGPGGDGSVPDGPLAPTFDMQVIWP